MANPETKNEPKPATLLPLVVMGVTVVAGVAGWAVTGRISAALPVGALVLFVGCAVVWLGRRR